MLRWLRSNLNLKKIVFGKPKRFLAYSIVLVLITAAIIPAETFAQTLGGVTLNPSNGQSSLQGFGQFASIVINIFTFIALLILSLVGDLMGTDFITGPEAMDALLPIWQYVRNMVNISAVLMIVYLSFSNLVSNISGDGGGGTWSWQIKDKLPRIIFMLVAINFSMLGFRLVIDAVNIGSITILSIADTQLESNAAESIDKILTGNKWRRVMKDIRSTQEEEIPDPNNEGTSIPKYKVWERESSTEGFFTKLEGKSCETLLQKDLTKKEIAKGVKLATQARKFDETGKVYVAEENSMLVCGSFNEQINSTFCADGITNDDCFFRIKSDFTFRNQQVKPGSSTAQNLFMAFGVVFMRIEQLPSLAANIENIFQVIDNTLFSALMAIMYVLALAALFFVLIARIIVLWLAIAFSPVVIGLSIMGINTPGGGISEQVVTHLLVPIKISAAFAISFVMMSSMIDFKPNGRLGMFEFGPSLSAIAVDEYAIMWQIATIIIFWKAAKWALEGTLADTIVKGIFDSAETVGNYALKAATIENQMFTLKDNNGVEQKLSLQGLLDTPKRVAEIKMQELKNKDADFYSSFRSDRALENIKKYGRTEVDASAPIKDLAKQTMDQMKELGEDGMKKYGDEMLSAANNKINSKNITATERARMKNVIARHAQDIKSGNIMRDKKIAAVFIRELSDNQLNPDESDFNGITTTPATTKSNISVNYTPDTEAEMSTNIQITGDTKFDGTKLTDAEKNIKLDLTKVKDKKNSDGERLKVNNLINNITGETTDAGINRAATKKVFEQLQAGKSVEEIWNDIVANKNIHSEVKEIFKYVMYDLKQVELKSDTEKEAKLKTFSDILTSDSTFTVPKTDQKKGNGDDEEVVEEVKKDK
jgi:hypothetical protein